MIYLWISISFELSDKIEVWLWLSGNPTTFSASIPFSFWVNDTSFFSFLRLERHFLISLNNSFRFLFLKWLAIYKKEVLLCREDNGCLERVVSSLLLPGKKDPCSVFHLIELCRAWLLLFLIFPHWLYNISCNLRLPRLSSTEFVLDKLSLSLGGSLLFTKIVCRNF